MSTPTAFAGRFLELNDVYWVLHSTNMFFKVSRYFYDESEFIVASLSPLRQGHPVDQFLKISVLQAHFCWLGDVEEIIVLERKVLLGKRYFRVSEGI